jgi:hypothetical protein
MHIDINIAHAINEDSSITLFCGNIDKWHVPQQSFRSHASLMIQPGMKQACSRIIVVPEPGYPLH